MAAARKKTREVPIIPVEQLLLDDANPRFADPLSQSEMLVTLAKDEKTVTLARHIAAHGLDPTSTPGAVLLGGSRTRYVVREGNRRLAALKLLNNPGLGGSASVTRKFQKIIDGALQPVPHGMPCVIFEGDEGDEWIALKHSGPQNGEGTVPWDAMQRVRFNLRTGRTDPNKSAQRLLEHAAEKKWLSKADVDSIGITNISRLLNDPDVQAVWGVSVSGEDFSIGLPAKGMKPFMEKLLTDWRKRKGEMRVADIYEKDDRVKYARRIVRELGQKVAAGATTIGTPPVTSSAAKAKGRASKASSLDRDTLIPRQFHVDIDTDRAHEIYLELRKLDVVKFRNAISMLFRTFVEWSAEHYCEKVGIPIFDNMSLNDKVQKVSAHMKAAGTSRKVLEPVDQIIATRNSIFTIKTFNQYVHNINYHPAPTDLKAYWDTLAPFLKLCWEVTT